ncbi:hypothetical protein EZ456_09955 [Pedobacter psychrodurus]|uniref:Uncharacterized protein n=1 Tax=Pedobacter psychrodurus TaxID=2530456 RepID=A0A4R0PXG1_9SPHI|nr:hypothetical protein [Pedobacter psychrodurus]TCD27505.1 hypothetical protein EZ456_09955 [Pedobacter psychrodurus]
MKPAQIYILKVCIATLIVSVPVTMAIGFGYIGLIRLINPPNWMFNFSLPFNHVFIFVAILVAMIMFESYLVKKVGYKRFINDRPVAHSIVIFLFYLIVSGSIYPMTFDHLLFSYAPMFLTAYLFNRIFSAQKDKPLPA